ncbi:MAG TPA: hypothetical protein VMZ31_05130 [Phycisphaerae bacterium]|nr:hypothetical protein [Phycisphaerae bacterium]
MTPSFEEHTGFGQRLGRVFLKHLCRGREAFGKNFAFFSHGNER